MLRGTSSHIIWCRYAEFGRERFRIAKPNQRNDKRLKSTLGGHVSVTPSFRMHLIRPLFLHGIPIKRDEILTTSSAAMASLLPRSRARGMNSVPHRVTVQCISGLPVSFTSLFFLSKPKRVREASYNFLISLKYTELHYITLCGSELRSLSRAQSTSNKEVADIPPHSAHSSFARGVQIAKSRKG